jgi:hypothetical protein
MKRRALKFYILSYLFFSIFAVPGHAAEVEGIYFEDSYAAGNTKLRLTGAGLLRYWGFKAYTGALYLEDGASIDDVLADTAKRIELEYFRSIKGKDFGPATDKNIAKNVDAETFSHLRPKIDFHNSLYQDVKPGDRYSLTYIPGRGTELALNGEPKGLIEGADFAAAVFSIWLGPEPINSSFKEQILGDR